jgi:hypothetical protein
MRRCPNPQCQRIVDDDLLVTCPRCHTSLSSPPPAPTLSQQEIDQLVDRLAKPVAIKIFWNAWFVVGFIGLLITLFGASYITIRNKLEDLMVSRIDEEFKEPRIQKTIQDGAKGEAQELLRRQVNPAVENFKNEVTEQVRNFQAFLKKTEQQIAALHPFRQPIVSATATMQLAVKSDKEIRRQVHGGGAVLVFAKGEEQLLRAGSDEYSAVQTGKGQIHYTSTLTMSPNSPVLGHPVSFLQNVESIKLTFRGMGMEENGEILYGRVLCIVNSSTPLVFAIPTQTIQGKEITIPDIREVFQSLKP